MTGNDTIWTTRTEYTLIIISQNPKIHAKINRDHAQIAQRATDRLSLLACWLGFCNSSGLMAASSAFT